MSSDSKQESRRQIAEQLVLEHAPRYAGESGLVTAIEAALKERDERAVRIIREHRESDVCKDNCWTTISAAIRNEDTNG